MSSLEDLGDAISEALETNPVSDVLGVLAGALVGLVKELTRRQGHDPDKTITIKGEGQREITIHAPGQSQESGK